MKTLIDPQPVVRKIDGGWDVSGVLYFMGSPALHVTKDSRFNKPSAPSFYASLGTDGKWYWIFAEEQDA
jgi:hypothetical protein